MKIGIGIGDIAGRPADINALIEQAKRAEDSGFSTIWLANIFGFEALTVAAVCGRETRTIEFGTGVVPSYPRHPHALAQQALSVNAAIGHRLALGIGLSHKVVIENMFGLSYAKSYSHMKEYLAVLAPLVREGKVSFQGEHFRVTAQVSIPGSKPCPILIAALAPKMLALAGSVADGTVTWMTGPKTLAEHIVPSIRAAASAAGRPSPRVVAGLPVAVTKDVAEARNAAGRQFRNYGMLPSYRAMLDREGAEGPADVVIAGDESTVGAELAKLADAGTTDFLWAPCPVEGDGEAVPRTRAFLSKLARA